MNRINMDIESIYEHFLQSGKVTTDSRNCPPGSIYFALKGKQFNGNDFALQALENGCSLAIVDDSRLKNEPNCYWVPDALKALQKTSTFHRLNSEIQVIGITGSNGKTTTKELIAGILSQKYPTWFTQGNLNNHIGVPLTLLSMPPGTQIAVVEMGANHQNEISELCEIAQPNMGLITNIGKAHLEGFGSLDGVKKAKGELYQHLIQKGGEIFINDDNPHLKDILGDYSTGVYRYGVRENNEVTGRNVTANPLLSFEWRSSFSEWEWVRTKMTGNYNFENALAAIIIGLHFRLSAELINKALMEYTPINHRSQLIHTKTNTVILDAYNANPSSMAAALENFIAMKGRSKTLILGEMKEVGKDTVQEHQNLIARVMDMCINQCFLIGVEFKEMVPDNKVFQWFPSREELLVYINKYPVTNSLVLIKGSRANQLEEVIKAL